MGAVSGDFSANGGDVSCVDAALVSLNVAAEALRSEYVPERFDKFKDSSALFGWAFTPFEVFLQFFLTQFGVKDYDVISWGKGLLVFAQGFSMGL